MLRYSVKPSKDTDLRDFPIRELFVSPDLSYISGTTDTIVGLVDGEQIVIKSPYLIGSELNTINVQTVKRQGKVEVSIELPVNTITEPLNFPVHRSGINDETYILAFNEKVQLYNEERDFILSSVTQNYVEYRGDVCYFFHGTPSGYLIDHKFYKASKTDKTVRIKTYVYIEDGKMQIGDYTYYADYSKQNQAPELRLDKEHTPIHNGDFIGLLDGYKCYMGTVRDYKPEKWERVSKFYIEKKKNPTFNVDDVLYGGYKHYITFKGDNYYLRDVYQYDEEQGEDVYMGYGILMNDTFYKPDFGFIEFNRNFIDESFEGSHLYLGEYDENLEVHDSLISPVNGGRFVILMGADAGSDVMPGNFILAESNGPILIKKTVETDEDVTGENKYIIFEAKKYVVENHLCDTVNVSGEEFMLTYLNKNLTSASTVINGETMYFDVSGGRAVLSNKVYYATSPNNVEYGINTNGYAVTNVSGVTIDGDRFPVVIENGSTSDGEELTFEVVNIEKNIKITLEVTEKNGQSSYLAYPVVDEDENVEVDSNLLMREYSNILVNNWKSFSFVVRKDTFGKRPLTPKNGLMDSMKSLLPYTISDAYLLENKIEILRLQNYLSFKFPLTSTIADNLRREEIIKTDFVDYMRGEAVNTVVDMEKDIYHPVYISEEDGEFKPIQQLRFNLHFRTRNFDNWKTYEDDREFKNVETPNSVKSNWFVMDLNYYKQSFFDGSRKYMHNASDLLGLMNFTTDDVKNQANKIGKSFLRISFYSTNNPKTQVLLATSTIFLDENIAYKKYINSKRNADLIFIDAKIMQEAGYKTVEEYIADVNAKKDKYQVSSNTISDASEVYTDRFFNEDTRLSSRLVVNDKYNSDTSSEGYYLYIFKDYATKMREQTIYMKVDFNHAGIGQTMSFMYPRRIGNGDFDGSYATPLYLWKEADVKTLKDGFKLTDIYNQTHIPIKVIYDDKTNKYVYYLPESLRENKELGIPDEIMEFNLFETKFANESIVENES